MWGLLLTALLCLVGCAPIQLVADYDAVTYEETIHIAEEVDRFYLELLDQPLDERPYEAFRERWLELEVELRTLVRRNAARPRNDQSVGIAQAILEFWQRYRRRHQERDTYPDAAATFDWERFQRLFDAAASAEMAKQLGPDDLGASADGATGGGEAGDGGSAGSPPPVPIAIAAGGPP